MRKERYARQLTEINSDTKARRDTGNKAEPEMSVCPIIFEIQKLMYILTKGCIRNR